MPKSTVEYYERLRSLPTDDQQFVEGATPEEIQGLEQYVGGSLPATYTEFLARLGRSAGELFRGTQYSVAQRFRLRLREHAERILSRSGAQFELSKSAFVFLLSPGSQFTFFEIDQSDNPRVYHYREGDTAPTLLAESLSEYLECAVKDLERGAASNR